VGRAGVAGLATRPPQPPQAAARTPLISCKRRANDIPLSHHKTTFCRVETVQKGAPMFWKFLSLQKFLDALFDDSWFNLGLPEGQAGMELLPADSL
jgi:hypothetical protein